MVETPPEMAKRLRAAPVPAYCWGAPRDSEFAYAALSGLGLAASAHGAREYVPSRPALDEQVWKQVDRALDESRRACELNVIIALVADDAEHIARLLHVWAEPGPDVIAIGHADRSVSFCIGDDTVEVNDTALTALLRDAGGALQRGDVASALLSVASSLGSLRLPDRLRGGRPSLPRG